MGGVAKTVRRWLTPPKWIRRAVAFGGRDWVKEYEIGPKLAAAAAAAATGNPYIGAGIGTLIHGTTGIGKALAEGRPWYKGALEGGTAGFAAGVSGGWLGGKMGLGIPGAYKIAPFGSTPIKGGGWLKGGQIFNRLGEVVGTYIPGTEAQMAAKLAYGIPMAGGGVVGAPKVGLSKIGLKYTPTGIYKGTFAFEPGVAEAINRAGGITWEKMIGPALAVGSAAASLGAKAPEFEASTLEERLAQARKSVLAKYMGDEAAMKLPKVAAEEYLKQITTPLGELYPQEVDARWGRIEKQINQSWDSYEDAIKQRFAQVGGTGSRDEQQALAEARDMRTAELTQARREIEQDIFNTQIRIKQDALAKAAQQGYYDEKLAVELASLIGQDEALQMAVESQDYETFQKIMSQLFQLGGQISLEAFKDRVRMT